MMRRFLLLFVLWHFSGLAQTQVLVSIAPQKFLVEEIGGDLVDVTVIVPAGASSHTYEPTPKQLVSINQAKIWFRMGESFEKRLINLFPQMLIVDQQEGIELLGASCCCCQEGADPHTWLSPQLLKIQAEQIAATLSHYDSEHAAFYRENLAQLEKQLETLDEEMAALLAEAPKTILVSHPAFGYLCRDYGLTQLSIEKEGREPTPRYLTELILKARALNIQTVFLQKQHSMRGGERVAQELKARTVYLDPYALHVIDNLREIAKAFRQ